MYYRCYSTPGGVTRGPTKGTRHRRDSYLRLDWEVSFTPLCVGWHLAVQDFTLGITWERCLKLPGLDLIVGS
jgi:hypothetical protein